MNVLFSESQMKHYSSCIAYLTPLAALDPVPVVEDRCLAALRLLTSLHPRRCLCFRREIELGNDMKL